MRPRRDNTTPAPTYGPDLADLIATERRLERELGEARAAADALIAAARTAAARHDGNHAEALRLRRVEIDAEVDAHTERRITAMTSLTRAQVARLDAIEGALLDGLARRLAQRLLSAVARGEAP